MPTGAEAGAMSGPVTQAIAIAGVLLLVAYLFLGKGVFLSRRILYAFLRAGALGLLAFALLRPQRTARREVTSRHALGVLVDNSRSLRFPLSARSARTRLEACEKLLTTRAADLAALSRRYDVKAYTFDRELARRAGTSGPIAPPAADGEATALGEALLGALDGARGGKLAGLVVISDGRSNLGISTGEAAGQLASEGVPVHALALGDGLPFADLRIAALDAPPEAAIGKPIRISVRVEARAVAAGSTELVMRGAGKEIARRRFALRAGDSAGDMDFTHTPSKPGTLVVEAAVRPVPGEFVRANNRRLAFVGVEDRTLRVVYLEGVLRQDYRAIRRALGGASGIDLDVVRAFTLRGPDPSGGDLARVRWDEYDVFVLGEIPDDAVPRSAAEKIGRLVSEFARGLVVLSGPEAMRSSPVRHLLPVRITDFRPAPSATVLPTDAGRDHPALRIGGRFSVDRRGAADALAVWARMGPLGDRPRAGHARGGGKVLLAAEGGEPVLVAAPQGSGRAAVLLSGATHVWADNPSSPREAHARLIRSMVAWSAGRDSSRAVISVELGKRRLYRGDLVTIIARVNRTRARELGLTDAEIDALRLRAAVFGPVPPPAAGGARRTSTRLVGKVSLERIGGGAGRPAATSTVAPVRHEGSLVAKEGGVFRVRVEPARRDKRIEPAETLFVVAGDERELARVEADPAALRRVCKRTGGVFARAETPAAVFQALLRQPPGTTVTVRRRRSIWDTWWVATLFLAALFVEWWMRRR